MNPTLILSSIIRDIATCARDQAVPNPDVELLVSSEMRSIIGIAMEEAGEFSFVPSLSPAEQLHQARITTLWNAEGCFAVVRAKKKI